MTSSSGSPPPLPGSDGDEGIAALVAAMETAPAAIYVLSAASAVPVWANARARGLGAGVEQLPEVDGRPVAEIVDAALHSGLPSTVRGRLGPAGPQATAMVRPLRVQDGPGVLLVLESDDAATDMSVWPKAPADGVSQAQLALLPPSLPLLPDLHLSGSYHRASTVEAAGGDWYDTVSLGAGRVALVVGDAVGHGVPAASAMSRLRGAMRSSALRDPSPSAVLAALDAFAAQMEDVEGASVFYGVLDASTGDLTYSAAGHPPPLIVGPDGKAAFLPVPPRPPLGSVPGAQTTVSRHVLELGATLVLFSNGAVAGAGNEAAQALDRLAQTSSSVVTAAGALEADGPDELATAIAEGVGAPSGWLDDVAVLVAHRRKDSLEPLQLDLLADPAALPGVRRRLNGWLTALGMGEQDRVGVMVAVGEACANAAEHAYRGSEPGPMSVSARVDVDGVLTVTVRDEGTWRPPNRDPGDRGRGLLIMRQLVDGVVLEEQEKGTTVTLTLRLRRSPDAADHDRPSASNAATVTVDREGPRPVVRVAGAVDDFGAEQMRIRLLEASHGGTGRVELDLVGVSLFSSAAVRVVLAVARIGRDEGWRLVVHAPEGGITRHILEISGLGGLVDLR
ncbi:SpoIIE family protein phosphatase [Blastococcus haudaquaticus]|uniref:STAS domain-containing protein n=1 Tax=Blastococcus haudaquaticus TaxID=1938745 RepID=A0A286GSW4_9ACTN|nr:SpoIIE family protein phosphatase [Blastococcus haudaquaticus]SOD98610.1 STAS domain-containing protein [Blastococcus haudaquaticus]